jgi:hypothetical protein
MADVAIGDKEWLAAKLTEMRNFQRISATAIVSMGAILVAVKARCEKNREMFTSWFESAGLSQTQAYRLMTVYNTLKEALPEGTDAVKRFRPTALYLLCQPTPTARLALQDAVHMAKNNPGAVINTIVANELLDSHKPIPAMTKKQIQDLAPIQKIDKPKAAQPAPSILAESLLALLRGNVSLTITATIDAENGLATYHGILLPDPELGGKRLSAVRGSVEDLIPFLAGTEPTKTCRTCKVIRPVSDFSKDANQVDSRCPSCRDCERPRTTAAKRRQRARQRLQGASRTLPA